MANDSIITFDLHPRQAEAAESKATELLYGGAGGGGKSFLTRVLSIQWALEIPGINIFLFRRLYDDLIKNHIEGPLGYRAMLAPWLNGKSSKSPLIAGRLAEMVQGEIRFWNGSKIFLCHLQHQKDITKYYGPEFHVLFIEEATQFTEFMIRFLRSRLRMPDTIKIPEKYKGLFPRAIYTTNPGGIGHQYFKRNFISAAKPYELHRAPQEDGGYLRQYIPARLDDNPSLNREQVFASMSGLPPALRDAILNGNWNAVIGAFYPEINPEIHVVPPFLIPDHWPRFMAMDWGACGDGDPFSIGWWTVSDGSYLPRGSLICYRRWYGRGLPKVSVHQISAGIKERELGEKIVQRVAGGDILEKRGNGPSVFEIFSSEGIHFQRADMRRATGWIQVRERLLGKNDKPLIYWTQDTEEDLELLSNVQHDLNDPSDVAAGDDHCADQIRYMCQSRPFARKAPEPEQPLYRNPTIDDLWKIRDQQTQGRR